MARPIPGHTLPNVPDCRFIPLLGKKYMGIEPSTFVLDASGKVLRVMRGVKPDTHADDVLAALP